MKSLTPRGMGSLPGKILLGSLHLLVNLGIFRSTIIEKVSLIHISKALFLKSSSKCLRGSESFNRAENKLLSSSLGRPLNIWITGKKESLELAISRNSIKIMTFKSEKNP